MTQQTFQAPKRSNFIKLAIDESVDGVPHDKTIPPNSKFKVDAYQFVLQGTRELKFLPSWGQLTDSLDLFVKACGHVPCRITRMPDDGQARICRVVPLTSSKKASPKPASPPPDAFEAMVPKDTGEEASE